MDIITGNISGTARWRGAARLYLARARGPTRLWLTPGAEGARGLRRGERRGPHVRRRSRIGAGLGLGRLPSYLLCCSEGGEHQEIVPILVWLPQRLFSWSRVIFLVALRELARAHRTRDEFPPVSYTHLTLPTICSV